MKDNDIIVFPTLLNYVENFLTIEQCKEIIKFVKNKKYKKHNALEGNSISNHGLNDKILSDINKNVKNCKNIEENLLTFINKYTDKLGVPSLKLTNSWINFQNKGSKLLPHCHPGNVVSGVMYLNIDNNSSKIYFHNPNQFTSFMAKKESSQFVYDFQIVLPKIGDLILFPSWLQHSSGTDVNMTEERVALSFNAR